MPVGRNLASILVLKLLLFSSSVFLQPISFLEVEKDSFISADDTEIRMIDLSNQKWLRAIIYSQNPIEVKYNKGSCIKSFADWDTLKDLNGKVNTAQTYFTSHIISMDSEDLRTDIEQYKKNNEDFQISFYDGEYWSCFEFTEVINENSMINLADDQPSTFCGILTAESYWKEIFNNKGISCDSDLNLTRESSQLIQSELTNTLLDDPDSVVCKCNETYESFCRLPDSDYSFEGFCTDSNVRIVGKTYYPNGGIFDGVYRDDNSRYIGTLEWDDGNKLQGEFAIDHNEYTVPEGIEPDEYLILGEYLLGTITSRGFFTSNEDDFIVLTGYGNKFNTNPEDGWTYQAGFYENDELVGESLLVLEDEEIGYELALWFDVSKKENGIIYYNENGNKSRKNADFEDIAEGWGEEGEAAVQKMRDNLLGSYEALEANFTMLEEKKLELANITADEEKTIKPLSSEMTSSIQELLAALGYETGKIDGILGRLTIAAIKAFQAEAGLQITGRPSEDLLIRLQTELRRSKSNPRNSTEDPVKLPVISTGTGFHIQDFYVVTNHHVVKNCNYLTGMGGTVLTIEAEDLINDIAVLKSQYKRLNILPLSINPELGQIVYTGGFPYNNILQNFNFTSGNISSLKGPGSNISEFQFTAPIQPGNSGGAVLNEKGGVIGITVSTTSLELMKETESIPQNINFGIKVEVLKDILVENQIDFSNGNSFWFRSSQEGIAQLSKDASTVINCHAEKK